MRAYVLVHATTERRFAVRHLMEGVEGVTVAQDVVGAYDVIASVVAATMEQLEREILPRIRAIDGVLRALICLAAG